MRSGPGTPDPSSPSSWRRSMKRKLDQIEKERFRYSSSSSVARVEIENECVALRETLSRQQQAINDLYADLEEERNASSSAANEAMSMILRLQREKAEIQMEDRQFKRFAEEKMAHDQHEILTLEDALYKRQQAIQALSYEVQACKHRLLSYGVDPNDRSEVPVGLDGISNSNIDEIGNYPGYDYPPLRCNVREVDVNEDTIGYASTPRGSSGSHLDVLEKGVLMGNSPCRSKHSRKISTDSFGSYLGRDHARYEEFPVMVDQALDVDGRDDMSDRVYTVDTVYVGTPRGSRIPENVRADEPEIQKLYMRLQELEADRESLKEAIISMRTDKAQLVLLKEIAQNLSKGVTQPPPMPERRIIRKQPLFGSFSFIISLFKWVASFIFWKKKASQSK